MPKFLNHLDKLNKQVGQFAMWLLPLMICLAFAIVVLRYVFNYGRVDMQEGVVYLHMFVLTLCMAYTLRNDDHVRVDIWYNTLPAKTKAMINLIGDLLFLLPTCATVIYYSSDYVATSWLLLEHSQEAAGLHFVFILKTLIPVMAGLLIWQGAIRIAHRIYSNFYNST